MQERLGLVATVTLILENIILLIIRRKILRQTDSEIDEEDKLYHKRRADSFHQLNKKCNRSNEHGCTEWWR